MEVDNYCILEPIDPLNISFSEDKCVKSPQTMDKSQSGSKNFLNYQQINIVRDPRQLFGEEVKQGISTFSSFRTHRKQVPTNLHHSSIPKWRISNEDIFETPNRNKNSSSLSFKYRKCVSSSKNSSEKFRKSSTFRTVENKKIGIFEVDQDFCKDILRKKILNHLPSSYTKDSLAYHHQQLRATKEHRRFREQIKNHDIFEESQKKNTKDIKKIDSLIQKINDRLFLSKRILP